MGAVAARLRTELRHRWGAWVSLAMLLALFGGAVLAATAGARRTHTAYQRYLVSQRAFDQFLLTAEDAPAFGFSPRPDQLRALPEVEAVSSAYFFNNAENVNAIATDDPGFDRAFNVPTAMRGRLPRPDRVDEAAVPVVVADQLGLKPGDRFTLRFFRADAAEPLAQSFTVTGISIAPAEIPPGGDIPPPVRLTPAFYERFANQLPRFQFSLVRLHRGAADLPAFRARLDALAKGGLILGYTQHAVSKNIQRSFELQSAALWTLALILGAAGVAIFAQTLARQTALEAGDYQVLRAIGMSRRQLTALGLARTALIGVAGAIVAVAVAFGTSPLAPRGLARAVEPDPGLRFDPVLLIGGIALAVLALALGAFPAWLAARRAAVAGVSASRTSATAHMLARAVRSPAAVVGARFALEPGRGRNAVPVRSTMAGAVLALGALALAFTFGAGLDRLLAEPRLYGLRWDMVVFLNEELPPAERATAAARIRALDGVEAAAPAVMRLPVSLDGRSADGLAVREQDRDFLPPLLAGRQPRGADEIVVGPRTSRLIGKGIGDTVTVTSLGGRRFTARIVGIGVVPPVGHTGNLGEGTQASPGVVEKLYGLGDFGQVIVRLEPGADPDAVKSSIGRTLGHVLGSIELPQTPADIVSFGRDRNLPYALAGVLAVMAAGTIAHVLVTSIARRRHDLAILKTVGFVRAQVGGAVAWQASVLVALAVAVGIPVGVAAGRWLWTGYATSLGVIPVPVVPLATVLLIAPGALALANLLAVPPGRAAARTRPAAVLRTE